MDIEVSVPIQRSFRVEQMAGMFDVALEERSKYRFTVDPPELTDLWTIGCIVGASGSGKSTILREAYGHEEIPHVWDESASVLDGFPDELSIKDVYSALISVGFSSPPSWVRPYRVLSNGEKFRAEMARRITLPSPLIVVDEFTSVVDRQVAKVCSMAVARAIRQAGKRLLIASCHYDILDWIQPDWVLDTIDFSVSRAARDRPSMEMVVTREKKTSGDVLAIITI